MSRTACSQARRTVAFGVSSVTSGRRGAADGYDSSTALQPSVAGRRFASDWVIGSQRMQVCHVPFDGILATNTRRPFAYCGGASALSTARISSRWNESLS
jgi:hypothetical protein